MVSRFELYAGHIGSAKKTAYIDSSFDYLNMSSMLSKEENVPFF
jgi:hypothetical protein